MKFLFGKGDLFSNPLRSQISPALICVSLFLIIVAKFIYDGSRPHGRHIEYNLIWLANNYFQFGAMRRALVGSVIYISGIDLVAAAYLLYGISISLILLFAYVFIRRIRQASGTLLPFALILGALLLFWSEEVGRTDAPVAAILMAAALALLGGRIVLASLCVAIGLQIHEVTVIYGLPLAAALLLQESRYKKYRSMAGATAALILIGGILFYAASLFLPRASGDFIAKTISSRLPVNFPFDSVYARTAMSVMLGGTRSQFDFMCPVSHSVHYYINVFVALSMVALAGASMSEGTKLRWASAVIATVPPIVFLWLTGTDMGRWVAFAILNVWIICASSYFEPVKGVKRWALIRAAGAAAIIPLLFPIPIHFFYLYPSPLIEDGIEEVIGRPVFRTFDECDPTWRAREPSHLHRPD